MVATVSEWHQASLVIGVLTFIIIAVFFLVKWIVSAAAGHALVMGFFEWRRRRRRRREEQRMKPSGITVECVRCKGRRLLGFAEAAALDDPPFCERCLMPMVAVEASVAASRAAPRAARRGGRSRRNDH